MPFKNLRMAGALAALLAWLAAEARPKCNFPARPARPARRRCPVHPGKQALVRPEQALRASP